MWRLSRHTAHKLCRQPRVVCPSVVPSAPPGGKVALVPLRQQNRGVSAPKEAHKGSITNHRWLSSIAAKSADDDEAKPQKKVKTVFRDRDRRGEPCPPKKTLPEEELARVKDRTLRALPAALDEVLHFATHVRPRKFDEMVDLDLVLSVDPRKPGNTVRTSVTLPHGTGKHRRVAAFAMTRDAQAAAKNAGADVVGGQELIDAVTGGEIAFDVACATEDAVGPLKKAARVLGPKGLLPSPKTPGTLAPTDAQLPACVEALKRGLLVLKTEPKMPLIHAPLGRVSFGADKLLENLKELLLALQAAKPEKAPKGRLIKKASLTSTMGAGIPVDPATLDPSSPRFLRVDPTAVFKPSMPAPKLAATPWSTTKSQQQPGEASPSSSSSSSASSSSSSSSSDSGGQEHSSSETPTSNVGGGAS